ncbi:MAG: DNA polymerase III subunit alpha [Puniceicoccaceae bacterium]
MGSYVELHGRSAFSFLRGASSPERLAETFLDKGYPVAALCDRNGLYGIPRFHRVMRDQGGRAIVGSELEMEDGSVLPVLVEKREGYRNLCRLLSEAHIAAAKGEARISWERLRFHAGGLVALTGDEDGPLARAEILGGKARLQTTMEQLVGIFGRGNLYVELQRHGLRGEDRLNGLRLGVAEVFKLPLLATNVVTYAEPGDRKVADVFTCLRHHTHLEAAGRLLSINAARSVQSPEVMERRFADLPESILNTARLAERIEFTLGDLGYAFPRYPVPEGETMDSFLRKMCWFGAEHRYGSITPKVRSQIEHELRLISKLGFSGYFLIVWDIVNFCRERGILVQGRGSAANSAVCYSLGITAVDPVGGKLLFERFLSEGRKSWPDIDLDLPSGTQREAVIQEVYGRYGKRGAAMTANVICYRGRSAVREIGKVLDFPEECLNRFSSLHYRGDYRHTLELEEQLEKAGIRRDHPRTPALVDLYQRIHGLPRHLGQHSGGMILSDGGLDAVVPLENASMPGRVVAQWDKDDCEDLGIIKVDLLGLGMMAVLEEALELTRQRGHPVDLASIPKDDEQTYEMLQKADTIGVFQVESRAQMATLPRLKPKVFYDLVVEVAIVRPGPIVGKLAHPYLERRAGREKIDTIHPDLEPVLERTLGVPLFQEQVLKMAMVMADFTGSEAEELRRALGFSKNPERLERVKEKLRAAMRKKGHRPEVIDAVTGSVSSFALYGFPESHAISFAILAYASAYLKRHYPVEFYTGLLNNQPMGFYSPATLIQDAKRRGIRFLPVSVIDSQMECTILDDATIRLGLNGLRGVGRNRIEAMLEERERRAFAGLEDFRDRTQFNRDELRVLAKSGSLNGWGMDRREALWRVEERTERAGSVQGWLPLLDAGVKAASPLAGMTPLERIESDFATTGSTVGGHPLTKVREQLTETGFLKAAELGQAVAGKRVKVAGAVICRQRPGTAKGVVFLSLEDESGIANIVVWRNLFERERLKIVQSAFLGVEGFLEISRGVTNVVAEKVEPLSFVGLPEGASHDFH